MVEASQSALRVILLVTFTLLFAGLWANDKPVEMMAQKEPEDSGTAISQQTCEIQTDAEIAVPQLEEISENHSEMMLTVSIESTGLTLSSQELQTHIRQLPLGIIDGDYLIVDPHGGVGWLKIRGQKQYDAGESLLTTSIGDSHVRYIRVTLSQIAAETLKTLR